MRFLEKNKKVLVAGVYLLFGGIALAQAPADTAASSSYESARRVGLDTVQDTTLYPQVDRWLGTPYQYGGTDTSGTDCSGLAGRLYQQCYGISLARSASSIYQQCTPVRKKKLQTGDLVFFKITGNQISHVGVYLANGKFVHASTQAGVIISDLSDAYYKKHFYKGGRVATGN